MNIQMQLCGLLIFTVLLIFYKSHRTLMLYSEKIFIKTLRCSIISLLLDIMSIVVIYYMESIPMFIVETVCRLYIVSIVWVSMYALGYVLTDLYKEYKHKKILRNLVIFTIVECIIVFCLPIGIHANGMEVYTFGPAILCVYGFVMFNIGVTVETIIVFNKKMNRRRCFAVGLWMFTWILAAIIQFLNNELLIIGFASSIGILILFVIMENPEANIDRRQGCFNSHALLEFINMLYERNRNFATLEITFKSSLTSEESSTNIEGMLRKVLSYVNRKKNVWVFKNVNSDIVIISRYAEDLEAVAYDIQNILAEGSKIVDDVTITLTPNGNNFANANDYFNFMTFIRVEYMNEKGAFIITDDKVVERFKEQYKVEQKIKEALDEDRVEVFLQPIFSNKENRFTSAEALARIREKDGSLLSPGVFIPVAEVSGQILELGERVVEKVCDFLKNSEAIKYGIHYIEINLSIIQCEMKDLADRLIAIVEKYQIDPKLINLEITETASISARNTLLENMKKLIDYGFTFSLDDFGKGESNLMYVVEMPVSFVKLDYDMSKAFFKNAKAKHVVRAVVNMAHGMDLKLVAEGIETKEEIDGMYEEGIDYIQGYYYAKPLPMDQFMDYLRNVKQI